MSNFIKLLIILCTMPLHAGTEKIALVIGNSNYQNIQKLANPINDAIDISSKLKELNFNVRELHDARLSTMKEAIAWFKNQPSDIKLKLFYYAGHATQLSGKNYLIPLNSSINNQKSFYSETISIDTVLPNKVNESNGISVVILDACRDNPFKNTTNVQWSRSVQLDNSLRSISRGLAPLKANSEVYIAFATGPGNVAKDGYGRNGTYTSSLLRYIDYPGITIEEMFKLVRASVIKETSSRQIPWEHSSLTSPVYLNNPVEQLLNAVRFALQEKNYGLAYRNLKKAKSTAYSQTDMKKIMQLEKKLKTELGVN